MTDKRDNANFYDLFGLRIIIIIKILIVLNNNYINLAVRD